MLRGWFDAFRTNGGPTLYSEANRTAAVGDLRNVLVYVAFSTLFVAFLIIFPGIRKERFSTFICVTTSLIVGAVLLLTNFGTDWHVATASISSPYRAFSKEKLFADVTVRIGLDSVNVTLRASQVFQNTGDINYNEKFTWIGATQMRQEYRDALAKGLPFPILTIAEYLSLDSEGFSWGAQYRKAGYYASILLWWSFSMWMLTNILFCMVPCYGAYTMLITGVSMLASNLLYNSMLPKHPPLVIRFEADQQLSFCYGWCFWAVVAAGALWTIVGLVVSVLDALYPSKFSTIFEVDYDTPYRYFVGQDNTYPLAPAQPLPKAQQEPCSSKRHHKPLTSNTTRFLLASTDDPKSPSSDNGTLNSAFDDDDDDEEGRESTFVDGKRAVSLRHFGKFAIQEAGRKKQGGPALRKMNSIAGVRSSLSARDGHVNVDLHAAASIW